MNRRDFLHPRRLAKTAAEVLDLVDALPALDFPDVAAADMALLEYGRRAMATTFEILLPMGTPNALQAANDAFDEIDRLEAQMTVYDDASEVSRLNQLAPATKRGIGVEEGLFDLLCLARQIWHDTGGAFDITTGALTKTWGFFRREGRVPGASELEDVMTRVGMDKVEFHAEQKSVSFRQAGLEINLGSIGKGYALDRAAALIQRWDIGNALLHGGHSSIYALGSEPVSPRGWLVGIRDPWQPERRLALVRLRNRGLATSAATFQHLEYNGKKLGHVLDPRNGWPADGVASATALAPTAATADALATAFYILGVEKTREYCTAHPKVSAIMLSHEYNTEPIVIGLSREQISFPKNSETT